MITGSFHCFGSEHNVLTPASISLPEFDQCLVIYNLSTAISPSKGLGSDVDVFIVCILPA
jgi:hypothetical protein